MSPTSKVRRPAEKPPASDPAVSITLARVYADRLAGRHALSQTGSNGPWPAADFEQPHARLEEWQEECRLDLRRALGMVGDHRGVMAVLVAAVEARSDPTFWCSFPCS